MTASKIVSPPYTTYKTFFNFISGLRKTGMPSHITRDILPGSNSGKATIAASLRYLGLIAKDDTPTSSLKQLVESEEDYSKLLKDILVSAYPFLSDGSIDLKNTTTDKLSEKFKGLKATGSTITKCMAFFLSACKAANIEVSPYVKTPAPAPSKASKRKSAANRDSITDINNGGGKPAEEPLEQGYTPFEIPIPGAKPVKLMLPDGLNEGQWAMFRAVLDAYLEQFQKLSSHAQHEDEDDEEDDSDF